MDATNCQVYLVGGAVRDELLGIPVTDRDWVVIGATPDDLLKKPTEKGRKGWKGRFLIAPTPFFGRSSWCGRFGTLPVAPVSSPRHPRPL